MPAGASTSPKRRPRRNGLSEAVLAPAAGVRRPTSKEHPPAFAMGTNRAGVRATTTPPEPPTARASVARLPPPLTPPSQGGEGLASSIVTSLAFAKGRAHTAGWERGGGQGVRPDDSLRRGAGGGTEHRHALTTKGWAEPDERAIHPRPSVAKGGPTRPVLLTPIRTAGGVSWPGRGWGRGEQMKNYFRRLGPHSLKPAGI